MILDNLSAHTNWRMKRWAAKNKVELCFTPTYASWANPIEAHFGPLRQFALVNSHHPNHAVQTRALHAYLHWRNKNARHPDVLTAQRRERARIACGIPADIWVSARIGDHIWVVANRV